MNPSNKKRVLLLCGGVGGAKLAEGFEQLTDTVDVTVLVNVGDDFEHLGLCISPDLDTVLYTLSGISNCEQGWGIQGETWRTLERLDALGGESWFRLGDLDLATHLFRTAALAKGQRLTQVAASLASKMGIQSRILPATDQHFRTKVHTDEGILDFQEYFVREQCQPAVTRIAFTGDEDASPSSELAGAVGTEVSAYDAIIIAPSNPFLSIDPILAVPGMVEQLQSLCERVIAVSPIVGGRALKGPAAKLMLELGHPVSAAGWAMYLKDSYGDFVDEWVFDAADFKDAERLSNNAYVVRTTNTVMTDSEERRNLALWLLECLN